MAIIHGLGDPKAMVKTAADGKPVNIPARAYLCDGGTEEIKLRALMVWRRLRKGMAARQIRLSAFNSGFHALE